MPFFPYQNADQFRQHCRRQTLTDLTELNHQYGERFEKISDRQLEIQQHFDSINQEIILLEGKIKDAQLESKRNNEYRQSVLENLPHNGAERHLIMQSILPIYDSTSILAAEIAKLNKLKENLNQSLISLNAEVGRNVRELKIINAVIDEKKQQVNLESTNSLAPFR
ncbi:hypothetical protein ACNVED_11935 [Legionella sp. D16C41]|uniref:hypothetical protein n=1 Tax=Legionella sp. D16C41 TaxID=3402688 RepID=UPI003AF630A5